MEQQEQGLKRTRKKHSPEFKAKVALAGLMKYVIVRGGEIVEKSTPSVSAPAARPPNPLDRSRQIR